MKKNVWIKSIIIAALLFGIAALILYRLPVILDYTVPCVVLEPNQDGGYDMADQGSARVTGFLIWERDRVFGEYLKFKGNVLLPGRDYVNVSIHFTSKTNAGDFFDESPAWLYQDREVMAYGSKNFKTAYVVDHEVIDLTHGYTSMEPQRMWVWPASSLEEALAVKKLCDEAVLPMRRLF